MPGMPTPDTETFSKTDTSTSNGWKVVLFDDDVTPFDIVIYGIQRAAGLSEEVAHMIANEAHNTGEAIVRSGLTETEAQQICAALRRWTRVPDICPGVHCEAMPDENS
ncbi:MAG: ATP-dependent Clp protease adaptor ClpS [Planctomycetes bacterium]|nr:ATP-dependent Clp protease adaptor ClpS [Planctomycetota bacterium]